MGTEIEALLKVNISGFFVAVVDVLLSYAVFLSLISTDI